MNGVRLLLTGNPGTEDIISAEAQEEIPGSRIVWERNGRGRVLVEASGELDEIAEGLYSMKTIHSAVLVLAQAKLSMTEEDLQRIKGVVGETRIETYIPKLATFAVRSNRAGEGHPYTSMDIARIVGEAVIETAKSRLGKAPAVRLNSPSIVVYAEAIDDEFLFGILLTGERSRHRRRYRIYDHPAALKPTLAYAMLRISGARDGNTILDPMCGGGTIAIEAAMAFPGSSVICMDINKSHIRGAVLNARAARVEDRIRFLHGDARLMHEIVGASSVDVIVSNPPYGIRLGDRGSVRRLYRGFIPSISKTLKPGGRATLITTESDFILGLIRSTGLPLRLAHIRKVRHGDLWASIIVLEKES